MLVGAPFYLNIEDNFLTREECNKIIKVAEPLLERSSVMGEVKGSKVHEARTSHGCKIEITGSIKDIILKIQEKVVEVTRLPIENQEPPQVLKYGMGEKYDAHYDFINEDHEEFDRGGQRLYSFYVYLSDIKGGGETYFHNKNIKIEPKAGKIAWWNNTYKGHNVHDSMHQALPVEKGTKWGMTIWVRENKFV